jgi:hypothetical protein
MTTSASWVGRVCMVCLPAVALMASIASVRAEEVHLLCVWDDGDSTRLAADFPNGKVVMTYPNGDVVAYINGRTDQDPYLPRSDVVSGGQRIFFVQTTAERYVFGYHEPTRYKNGYEPDLGVVWLIDRGSHIMRTGSDNHTARCDVAGPPL